MAKFNFVEAVKGMAGFALTWSQKTGGFGFGEVNIYISNGKFEIDAETKSKEFVKELLNEMVDNANWISYEKNGK